MSAAQAAFDKFVADMKLPPSIYNRVDPQAEALVVAGYKPVLTGPVPDWAYIERAARMAMKQWSINRALAGQGSGSWSDAKASAAGASPQFTLRLLMDRGPAPPVERIKLTFWAMRNYPEEWDARTDALLAELGAGPSIDAGAIRAATAKIIAEAIRIDGLAG